MRSVLLGVSGGVAAYKAVELARLLGAAGFSVWPLLTPKARQFVGDAAFGSAWGTRPEHFDLALVAPCTANTLAKLALGLPDSLLVEAVLAHRGPTLVAPAMNRRMWAHPATEAHVVTLKERGVVVVGPEEGELAEGEWGLGRMSEPEQILARCLEALGEGSLAGRRVLVTAGGTREPIDAVRFLGNRSSGRMGFALAEEARRRGAFVTLLAANVSVPYPEGVEVVPVETAADLCREALARADYDLVLMAAAVADYRPTTPRSGKRPKDDAPWTLKLEPTEDVLAALAAAAVPGRVLVGFAAEVDVDGRGLERARAKRLRKGLDLVVYNDVSRAGLGFDAVDNEVVLIAEGCERRLGRAPKHELARLVLDEVEKLIRDEVEEKTAGL